MEGSLKGALGISPNGAKETEDWAFCLSFVDERWLELARQCEAAGIPCWSTVGHHYLKPGDRLTIYDKDNPSAVVWSGILSGDLGVLLCELAWMEEEEKAAPFPPPPGVNAATWHQWFQENYPATLVPAP